MMQVSVKLFATLTSHRPGVTAGVPFPTEVSEGATVEDLIQRLQLPSDEISVVYVNGLYRSRADELRPGDEVGLFPKIGGG